MVSGTTLLVYLASQDSVLNVLDVALPIAEKLGSRLMGMHVVPKVPTYTSFGDPDAHDVQSKHEDALRSEAQDIERLFNSRINSGAGNYDYVWCSSKACFEDLAIDVSRAADSADLIIMSQDAADPFDAWPDLPARVILGSGRPVLLVPTSGSSEGVGKHPLVAWKQSTDRDLSATFDVMPLLLDAEVVNIFADHSGDETNQPNGAEDLASNLARRNIKAIVNSKNLRSARVWREFFFETTKCENDLFVLGCYDHFELRERLFGGDVRFLIKNMPVPVLVLEAR